MNHTCIGAGNGDICGGRNFFSADGEAGAGSETLDAPDGSGKAEITSTDSAGTWAFKHEFETAPAIIPPPDYAALLKVESTLGRKSGKVLLLEKN